jgi:hypothetical protein
MTAGATVGVALLAWVVGCTNIPLGGDPVVQATSAPGTLGHLAVAPIATITLADSERSKQWKPEEVFVRSDDPNSVRRSIVKGLEKTGCFGSIREATSDDPLDAWEHHDDLVVSVAIQNLRIAFEENDYYYWNIVNFVFNIWPAWLVAKEDYTLSFDAVLTVRSADSGNALIDGEVVPVSVAGSFDEFDRGFQFFGCISPTLEADNWRQVASKLLPAARRKLGEKVAVEMDAPLRKVLGERPGLVRKESLVSVGITRYADTNRYAELAYAATDAAAITSAFVHHGLVLPYQTALLTDDHATRAGVSAAVDALFSRANDGDATIFYFAGYGTRTAQGEPALALYDSNSAAELLPLSSLVEQLSRAKGQKLIVLDCSFDQGRAVPGGSLPVNNSELSNLARPTVRILTACGPKETALAPTYLGEGLLTFELLQALSGKADENHNARVTLDEIFGYARDSVAAEASYLGETQEPRLAGGGELVFEIKHAPSQ